MNTTARIARYGVAAAVAVALTGAAGAAQAKLRHITIGTNPTGTVYYLIGSGFAKTFQEKLNIRSTAQPYAGSSVYVPLYAKGEMTLGLNNSMASGAAYRGIGDYKGHPMKSLRTLVRFWVIPYTFMVRGDSGIHTLADLRGKRVVTKIQAVTSLTALSQRVLETAGISSSSVTPMASGGLVRNVNLVVQGQAVASPVAYSMPAVRKANATVPGGIRILPLGPKGTNAFLDEGVPGSRTFIAKPSKLYPFIKKPTKVAAFDAYLNAGSAVSNEDAYQLVKTLYDNWKQLQQDYKPLRGVKASQLAPASDPIPYAEGAVRFYKEVGIWTKANQAQQDKVLKAGK